MQDVIIDPIQMSTFDMAALEGIVRDIKPDYALEIGSWKGTSTAIIARHTLHHLFCVDTWKGADNTPDMVEEANQKDIFKIFKSNMVAQGLWEKVHPLQMTSIQAGFLMEGRTKFQFVYIDGAHDYEHVYNDINIHSKLLEPGGIIAGHDLEITWSECDENLRGRINAERNQDLSTDALGEGRGIHPGVTLAIYELFKDEVNRCPNSTIWWKQL